MHSCQYFGGCCHEHLAGAFGRPQGNTSRLLAPQLLQDVYDEFVAKANARAQSAEIGYLKNPSTKDTPPAQEGGPSPAHMVMVSYSTLDGVTVLAAAAHIYC
jgi:hypothetical protein